MEKDKGRDSERVTRRRQSEGRAFHREGTMVASGFRHFIRTRGTKGTLGGRIPKFDNILWHQRLLKGDRKSYRLARAVTCLGSGVQDIDQWLDPAFSLAWGVAAQW